MKDKRRQRACWLPAIRLRSNFSFMTFALWAAPSIAFTVCLIRSDLGRAVAGNVRSKVLAWAAALRRHRGTPRQTVAASVADRG
jgi:hypothetical protein